MKTIFITGASSGLGKEAAKLFQQRGWQVIATMRNPENESELDKIDNIIIRKLDVSDSKNIETTIAEILKTHEVDVVLNNAGYGLVGALEACSDEQIARQIDTNLLGTIRVTKAFTPYFRQKNSGIFLNVTSMLGFFGYPTCSVYAATKFAVEGFSESLAYELAQFGISVKTIAPGGIQTDFAGRSLDGVQHEAYSKLEAKVAEGYSEENIGNFAKVATVANAIFEAATDGKTQFRYVVGTDAKTLYDERSENGMQSQFDRIREMFTV
ncbi:SDR family oxidoreductase [Flavobacterium sp.]|uniref:SDR family oxidoreductase n=1 Tax=Flavobacterium sp. TaxID=239 RepID=UPI0025C25A12|nr:SDR family oxidoreductase [Flavobacterium sp.]